MTKTEMKQSIHDLVDTIEDESKLEQIQEMLGYWVNKEKVSVSPEEMEAIEEGLKDVEEGRTISYEDFKKKHSEWFGK
jgi:predicted transcriptional regulator